MAEQIDLKVELQNNLQQLTSATKSVKLDKGQAERVEKYTKGAQLALDSGDLKTFQRNFNGLLKTFKDAAAATGKVSEEIQKLTARQSALSKEINELRDKKTKLETHSSGGKLTKEGANAYYKESKDATKVVKADGVQATRDEILAFQEELVKVLKEAKRNFQTMTTEDVAAAASKSGVNITTRSAAQAANRYVKGENAYEASLPGQINATDAELNTKEQEYATLTTELTRMTEAATSGAESIEKLYAEISKLGDATNKLITEENNKNTKKKADTSTVNTGNSEVPAVAKQASGLGKAFKQFTLYNVALRAVKTALREAVQTVKELDKYLTEQAMVTGKTREETYKLVGSYQHLAAQCGATTKEIAQVATEYMKQGKTVSDSLVLTEAAVKAAKVARVSVGDSVNYLTTALNGFQLEASEAMTVSDKFAALAASSATDYDELAIALSKVASQANLAGMSIDYTTALLTKGLETTREAPETMGTALKTIIARMRELGDYGETLDDGMDINNVESQLSYVGIALRDTSGELRSTEEVLDELGKKWDTLSKNQQAAVAKALAGTRQQARLIAMMEDYERVTELQEISQRSAGATAAQAGVYLEGREASMNKIQVAWEKIIMTITDSEVIISFLDYIGDALNDIGDFLSTDFGMVTLMTTLVTLGLSILGNKLREAEVNRQNYLLTLKENAEKLKSEKATTKQLIAEKRSYIQGLKSLKTERETTKQKLKQAIAEAEEAKDTATAGRLRAELAGIEFAEKSKEAEIDAEIKATKREITGLQQKELLLTSQIAQNNVEQFQNSSGLMSVLSSIVPILTVIVGLFSLMNTLQSIGIGLTKLGTLAIKKNTKAKMKDAAVTTGGMVAEGAKAGAESGGLPGFIAGLAIALGVAVAIAAIIGGISFAGVQINKANEEKKSKTAEGAAESINKLSNQINQLTSKANELNKITSAFEEIDNKVIKTRKDTEELESLLASAGDQMSTENEKDDKGEDIEGTSEQDAYNKLQTDEERLIAIKKAAKDAEEKADELRGQQLDYVKNLRSANQSEFNKLMTDTSNSDFLAAQSAIRAIAYDNLYEEIDDLKKTGTYSAEVLKDTEELTSSLVSNMSALEALDYAENQEKMKDLVNSIKDVKIELKDGKQGFATDIFLDEGKGIKDRIQAYRELEEALQDDAVALKAFQSAYSDWSTLSSWDSEILNFIDATKLSVDQINTLYESFNALQKQGVAVTREQYKGMMDATLKELDPNMNNLEAVLVKNFGSILGEGEDFVDNWDTLLNQLGNIFTKSMLDIGQSMEKFENTINNFYENALEWGEKSASEKMEFISENADIFSGEGGEELLKAFESSNYDAIETMLKSQLDEKRKQQLEEIERALAFEEARSEETQNKAYIRELKKQKAQLEEVNNLYKASLKLRLDQQDKQLEEYKSYLEKERDALTESLEKRKEAYEKYFDEISNIQEDQDFDERVNVLTSNIAKLSASGNLNDQKQMKELEAELQELEKERIQELRERAKEAVLENMDTEIEEINEKFDDLLENSRAILAEMQKNLENPAAYISNLIANKVSDGASGLQLEEYLQTLQTTYGSHFENGDLTDIGVRQENNQLILNVNGQEVVLDTGNEQNLYAAIMKALTEIGVR